MHLSFNDRLAIVAWTTGASQFKEEPFPVIDDKQAFLKRHQIHNYIRAIKYFATCGLTPLIAYANICLGQRGIEVRNVSGSAYILATGEYDIAYRSKLGYPVKNVTIAFPFHEKLYNLVMWGEDRAIETEIKNLQWLKLDEARAFPWLSKALPNRKPSRFEDGSDWQQIHFLKFTTSDFSHVLASTILDDFVMSPDEMLYIFGVLSGRVSSVKAHPRNSLYRVTLVDETGPLQINVSFSGCRFNGELSVGQHVACLCNSFIFTRVPTATETVLIDESTAKKNAAIAYLRFRRRVRRADFNDILGAELLDELRFDGFVRISGEDIDYVPRTFTPGVGYRDPDTHSGIFRMKNIHRFGNELYDGKVSTGTIYTPITSILAPLPEYLRVAGDLFYRHSYPRRLWKEVFEFAKSNPTDLSRPLPCPTCPVRLNATSFEHNPSNNSSRGICMVHAISLRLRSQATSTTFTFPSFEQFLRLKTPGLTIDYDQGDMVVRRILSIARISARGEVIGADKKYTEELYEDLIREFKRGLLCPYIQEPSEDDDYNA
jgi:hypothetical protein